MGDTTLLADLTAEHEALDAVVRDLPDDGWERPTPAPGWRVRDQIGHLAHYDAQATQAATDPARFETDLAAALSDPVAFVAAAEALGRTLTGDALLQAWREGRAALLAALAALPEGSRVPWYGPPMSVRSFATARLMETWAHGHDVVEAVGAHRAPTDRLRHICHLGVATYEWSFRVRGEEPPAPAGAVRVQLELPSGATWEAGAEAGAAGGQVRGPAEDFCLVVTQRRNVAATSLEVTGDAASAWMSRAQCFAGSPTLPPAPE